MHDNANADGGGLQRLWPQPGSGERVNEDLAVMFTDMADSTAFAEKYQSHAAHDKQQEHNRLVLPLIAEHGGVFIEQAGDSTLSVLGDPATATRCAIAIQRRLDEHNRSNRIPHKDFEIHVRSGIHFGKTCLYRDGSDLGRMRVVGPCVNTAARVEGGGGKQTDQILVSDAVRRHALFRFAEFRPEPFGLVDAKGIGRLRLFRIPWQQTVVATTAQPVTLSAMMNDGPGSVSRDADSGTVRCLFIDSSTGLAEVRPVTVIISACATPKVLPGVPCDRVMEAAAERSVHAAFEALQRLGFTQARPECYCVEWRVEDAGGVTRIVRYQGASIGLGVALATVAAYTGLPIDPGVVVSGAIHEGRVVAVGGISTKWDALVEAGARTAVLPSANTNDVPARAGALPDVRWAFVDSLMEAIEEVLGGALGLTPPRVETATQLPEGTTEPTKVELWVQPAVRRQIIRDISIVPEEDTRSWAVGDSIRVCARADRECYLSIVNIGPTGNVTVLWPNAFCSADRTQAGQAVTFPALGADFQYKLVDPPGRETLIALASDERLDIMPGDFGQQGAVSKLMTRDIGIFADRIQGKVRGRCQIEFYVSG